MRQNEDEFVPVSRGEATLLAAQSIVLGAVAMVVTLRLGPQWLPLSSAVWFGLAIALIMLVTAPVHAVLARMFRGRVVSPLTRVAAAITAGLVAGLVAAVMM